MPRDLHGYATDIPYLRDFKPQLAPAWLDHVALVAGVEPPARNSGFAWCDLGCGQGVTANILAATHPGGTFHAIDAMPAHIDHARRLAAEAAIPNVSFHAVDFTAAADLDLPLFDYIVAHGVYSWVDAANQRALRRFFDRRLKPGGLVYVSYNAMPGWARDLPFQRLARELARGFSGDSAARFAAALGIIRTLAAADVPALAPSFIVGELEQRPEDYAPPYLVHEFMPGAWQPLYVTEVRAAMKTIGLAPVGSATLIENLDPLVLSANAREILGASPMTICASWSATFTWISASAAMFSPAATGDWEANSAATRSWRAPLRSPAPPPQYATRPPPRRASAPITTRRPGRSSARLPTVPRCLADLTPVPAPPQDLATNILLLCAVGDAMPVEPTTRSSRTPQSSDFSAA